MDGNYITQLLEKEEVLDKNEIVQLLNVNMNSKDFYSILNKANELTRNEFQNKGIIFAQIGLNAEPCSANCKFCSMGANHYSLDSTWKKSADEVLFEIRDLVKKGINDLFLMTTADYPMEDYLKIGSEVKRILPEGVRLVANIGDFDVDTAKELKKVGFTGVYHIHRLREGIDTDIKPEKRLKTLAAIAHENLELYYCVEPIGPEHSYEEIADEIIRARENNVSVMAVMRRIPVKGTPLYDKGQISARELAKIAAVSRIASKPKRAMNAHEVTPMTLICGVNQLYAEYGANPRDHLSITEDSRGYCVDDVKKMLIDADYEIKN
ncbi:radical SAM protein [Vallitalea longa]|uniref:biotin synthase n=1 Tax=Vallitalea longa TaxID=2936439 RepID=A0A9W6DF00_9FIRM|nr:radical SAM protein [Vallitalea longa]GKX30721.1 radical SAM protein [Vallitalea longa]